MAGKIRDLSPLLMGSPDACYNFREDFQLHREWKFLGGVRGWNFDSRYKLVLLNIIQYYIIFLYTLNLRCTTYYSRTMYYTCSF